MFRQSELRFRYFPAIEIRRHKIARFCKVAALYPMDVYTLTLKFPEKYILTLGKLPYAVEQIGTHILK